MAPGCCHVQSGSAVFALPIDVRAGINQHLGYVDATGPRTLCGEPECTVATVAVFETFANKVDIHPRFEFLYNRRDVPHPCRGVNRMKLAFNSTPWGILCVFHAETSSKIHMHN